ncbi:MAG: peptide chain release factor N(5)-glutamine methyltransferase [Oscillospiraceae bacterium]|nr:peptide chain release factor N(5)-glutamine methyltransferase [Oscillospiraceae bacterium]
MKLTDPALLRELNRILRSGGIEDAELEAKWIYDDAASAEEATALAERRAKHEPLQYLLGTWEFYGLPMRVGKGVLIPRPDTETLVDAVRARLKDAPSQRVADLCTGSGCIALALALHMEKTVFLGLDSSAAALSYARQNLRLNESGNVRFYCANVLDTETPAQFSGLTAIVCNPPYLTAKDMASLQTEVTYEPAEALAGGEDGLDYYRAITRLWKPSLLPGGLLAYEVGIYQAKAVAAILAENGFERIETVPDLNEVPRVVLGYRSLSYSE